MTQDAYLLPNRADGAARRLALLAELYDAWTFRHLEACGVRLGMRCWEVGAGGPTVTIQMMRDALIDAGDATADELEAHLASVAAGQLDMAQPALVSAWGQKPANVP